MKEFIREEVRKSIESSCHVKIGESVTGDEDATKIQTPPQTTDKE